MMQQIQTDSIAKKRKQRIAVFQTKKGSIQTTNQEFDDADKENSTIFYPTLQNLEQEHKGNDNEIKKSINSTKQKVINKLISLNVEMRKDAIYLEESEANAHRSQSTLQNYVISENNLSSFDNRQIQTYGSQNDDKSSKIVKKKKQENNLFRQPKIEIEELKINHGPSMPKNQVEKLLDFNQKVMRNDGIYATNDRDSQKSQTIEYQYQFQNISKSQQISPLNINFYENVIKMNNQEAILAAYYNGEQKGNQDNSQKEKSKCSQNNGSLSFSLSKTTFPSLETSKLNSEGVHNKLQSVCQMIKHHKGSIETFKNDSCQQEYLKQSQNDILNSKEILQSSKIKGNQKILQKENKDFNNCNDSTDKNISNDINKEVKQEYGLQYFQNEKINLQTYDKDKKDHDQIKNFNKSFSYQQKNNNQLNNQRKQLSDEPQVESICRNEANQKIQQFQVNQKLTDFKNADRIEQNIYKFKQSVNQNEQNKNLMIRFQIQRIKQLENNGDLHTSFVNQKKNLNQSYILDEIQKFKERRKQKSEGQKMLEGVFLQKRAKINENLNRINVSQQNRPVEMSALIKQQNDKFNSLNFDVKHKKNYGNQLLKETNENNSSLSFQAQNQIEKREQFNDTEFVKFWSSQDPNSSVFKINKDDHIETPYQQIQIDKFNNDLDLQGKNNRQTLNSPGIEVLSQVQKFRQNKLMKGKTIKNFYRILQKNQHKNKENENKKKALVQSGNTIKQKKQKIQKEYISESPASIDSCRSSPAKLQNNLNLNIQEENLFLQKNNQQVLSPIKSDNQKACKLKSSIAQTSSTINQCIMEQKRELAPLFSRKLISNIQKKSEFNKHKKSVSVCENSSRLSFLNSVNETHQQYILQNNYGINHSKVQQQDRQEEIQTIVKEAQDEQEQDQRIDENIKKKDGQQLMNFQKPIKNQKKFVIQKKQDIQKNLIPLKTSSIMYKLDQEFVDHAQPQHKKDFIQLQPIITQKSTIGNNKKQKQDQEIQPNSFERNKNLIQKLINRNIQKFNKDLKQFEPAIIKYQQIIQPIQQEIKKEDIALEDVKKDEQKQQTNQKKIWTKKQKEKMKKEREEAKLAEFNEDLADVAETNPFQIQKTNKKQNIQKQVDYKDSLNMIISQKRDDHQTNYYINKQTVYPLNVQTSPISSISRKIKIKNIISNNDL